MSWTWPSGSRRTSPRTSTPRTASRLRQSDLRPQRPRAANAKRIAARDAAQKRLKELTETIRQEARALLKERFDYPIFMYEAAKVGISATGEADQNELYPNDNPPPDLEATCLDLYRQFRRDPRTFFRDRPRGVSAAGGAFAVGFRELELWSVRSFVSVGWHWPTATIKPLSSALVRKQVGIITTSRLR